MRAFSSLLNFFPKLLKNDLRSSEGVFLDFWLMRIIFVVNTVELKSFGFVN